MNVLSVAGIALAAVISFLFLRGTSSPLSSILPLAAGVLILLYLMPDLLSLLQTAEQFGTEGGVDSDGISRVFRGLGIALIARFASGICVDCGQRALADAVDYFGQIAIVSLALPLLLTLIGNISDII